MQLTKSVKASEETEAQLLPALIDYYVSQGSAFALWKMPHTQEKHLLVSAQGTIELDELSLEESEAGFVFAPFDTLQKKIFFRGDHLYSFKEGRLTNGHLPEGMHPKVPSIRVEKLPTKKPTLQSKLGSNHYQELVSLSIDSIRSGACEKIVPSRYKEIEVGEGFDCLETFSKLCRAYPNAFVSLVSSEATGTWMGATPELLVSLDANARFKTVALAGTKRLSEGMDVKTVAWTEKEIEEQALVCRYIISCFKKIRLREYEERGPRTVVAGNVVHLKTEFEVDTVATNFPLLASVMLKLLHPTSAVCGMPLQPAQQFLKTYEGYDREFYAGFLGPVNVMGQSTLFVNLRCMQLLAKTARLYAGAGVTVDSTPQKEYEETELKMEALLSVIGR
jgi:isochorismate synthase